MPELIPYIFAIIAMLAAGFAAYKVRSGEAWRITAEAASQRAEEWKGEAEAIRNRADRLQTDLAAERAIVSKQVDEIARLRERTNLQPVLQQHQQFHSEMLATMREIMETGTQRYQEAFTVLRSMQEQLAAHVQASTDANREVADMLRAVARRLDDPAGERRSSKPPQQ